MKRALLLIATISIFFWANYVQAKNFYPAAALTGGGTGALDKIDGAILADGDTALVTLVGDGTYGNSFFAYVLDADSSASESVPTVISPDTNAGTKRWVLTTIRSVAGGSTAEERQDEAGAMWSGNTETGITVTYQDDDGTIDAAVSISTAEVAAATLVTASETIDSNNNDTTLPTSAAVKAYADSVAGAPTNVTPVDTGDENATFYPLLVDGATGSQATETDGEFTYNPSTGLLTTPTLTAGATTLTGNVALDDGSGASPNLTFQDETNETAVFSKADSGFISVTTPAADGFQVLTGNLKVGNGTPTQSQDGEDAYVEGMLEVDGIIYADGGIVAAASATPSITLQDSDNAAGTGSVFANSSGGANDIILSVGVEDSTGESTPYIEVDGVSETVDILKPLVSTGAVTPASANGAALGSATNEWADLFLHDGGVIYGQANQSATLTSSASLWTANNFAVDTQFKLPSSNADPTATAGYLRHDSTISNFTNGGLVYHNGAAIKQLVDMTTATASACSDDHVVAYDADNDLWYCKADATGGNTALTDIGDATADGTIAAGGYETTITSTLDEADHSVLTIYNNDADRAANTALLTLKDDDGADANAFYLKAIGDVDGTPATDYSLSQTAFAIGSGVTTTFSGAVNLNSSTVIADSQTLTFDESAADPNDADIALSATDGVFKIAASNGANNEDLTIDLDATANTATLGTSTGVTTVSLGALNMATTGTILGAVNVVVTTDGALSPTAAQMYGTMFIADNATATNDTDYTLPEAAAGMSACFYDNGGGAGGIIIDAASGDEILLNGTGVGAADAIDSPGVAGDGANGDFICLMAIDATSWITLGRSGTWVDGGAD